MRLVLLLVISVSTITGCGLFDSQDQYVYRHTTAVKPLEAPSGLTIPADNQQNDVPASSITPTESIEDLERPPDIVSEVDLKELQAMDKSTKSAKLDKSNGAAAAPTPALSMAFTKNTEGESVLEVKQKFDIVWPEVKPALEELGFNIDDASRGRELYAISRVLPELNFDIDNKPIHPGDKKPEVKEEFQIMVKEMGDSTHITVHNKFGQPEGSGLADHLLLQIKEVMENPKSTKKS